MRPADTPITPTTFPRQAAAYGYWDDHFVAGQRIWSPADYLADRCGALLGVVPQVDALFVRYQLLLKSLEQGFNWAAAAHQRGIQLDAWTLDADQTDARANAEYLCGMGVDMLTTNTPKAIAALLRNQ